MKKPRGIYLIRSNSFPLIYGDEERAVINHLLDIAPAPVCLADVPNTELEQVECVFSGWGAPKFDQDLLERMPRLKAIFYGAGTVKGFVTDSLWERDITVTSAYYANAKPVAEFTFAQIIMSLKRTWQYVFKLKSERAWTQALDIPGCFDGTKVGLIALGAIGQMVCERLQQLDVEVLAYDPCISESKMAELGARKVGLEQLFAECDVVSLHAPKLDATLQLVKEGHFNLMPSGATFINTARGAIVDEPAMIRALHKRPDLLAILDVTETEPLENGSPLFTMPNVLLTPHIAGSMGRECRRMGRLAITECQRYLRGESPLYPVTQENYQLMA
ncbi:MULTISPECIES: hydroxyacid dehydrogenase [Cerasicoccus]|uniref:hydroxyacid dehydrogenase n=1 Tax=Cerasicoccus TaxID=468938 RepID=UPI002852C742|nr:MULTISPECIES: hydroxyacid dehydrogenase [Cerasicoccus]